MSLVFNGFINRRRHGCLNSITLTMVGQLGRGCGLGRVGVVDMAFSRVSD